MKKLLYLFLLLSLSACAYQRAKDECGQMGWEVMEKYGSYESCVASLHREYRAQDIEGFNAFNAGYNANRPVQTRCYRIGSVMNCYSQ